jgi:hypothetical protein
MPTLLPGLDYRIYPGTWPELPVFSAETPTQGGVAASLRAIDSGGFTRFALAYEGWIEVPRDGGYRFHLLDRDGARVIVDGEPVAKTGPQFAEVCGSQFNAMRYAAGAIGLRAGRHALRVEALESVSPEPPRLLWQGPGIPLGEIPAAALSHDAGASVRPRPSVPVGAVAPVTPSTR